MLFVGTIFMYGQTGSGKTFTMMGPKWLNGSDTLKEESLENKMAKNNENTEKTQIRGSGLTTPEPSEISGQSLCSKESNKSPLHRKYGLLKNFANTSDRYNS
mgnify:CR=1 FL=1